MSPQSNKIVLLEAGGVVLLSVVIFVLDLLMPLGWAVWLLYFVPLVLTLQSPRQRDPYYFAAAVTLLTIAGGFLSSEGIDPHLAFFNRSLGLTVMWAFTWMVVSRKKTQASLAGAQVARQQAETAPEEAVEARSRSKATLVGVLDRERHATEEVAAAEAARQRAETKVLASKLRLEGIIQSAMDAIITIDDEQLIVLFNRAAEEMFECKAEAMLGRPLDRLIPERFRRAHHDHIKRFGQSGVTTRQMGALGMITGLRTGGEEFPIEAAISQIEVEGTRCYTVILRDITERRRLENELAESEALLRAIIETEPECVKVLALDGTVRTINAAGLAMVEAGSSREIVGTDLCGLVASESQPAFCELIRKAGEGEAGRLEFEIKGLLGTQRSLETHMVPLRGAEGTITAVLGVTRDITERKKAEQRLRQSEERYRRLLSLLPDAVMVNRENRIIFINEQGLRLFGAAKVEDILGKSPYDLVHPDYHALVGERIRHLLGTGSTVPEVEQKIVRLDGTIVDVEVGAARFKDEEGVGILVVLRDMTQRKVAEQRLRESEERLQSLLGAMEDVIWSSSLDLSTIYYVSPSVSAIYARPAEDFVTRPALGLELVHPDDRQLAEQALRDLRTTGEFDVEYRIVRLDGDMRWLHDRRRVIEDDQGRSLRIDGIVSDITERKRLQAQLRRTERIAELGTLASGMAHEIGTPMNVILGRAEYLMQRVKEESIKRGLQTIVTQVERITKVMNQLLSFARRRTPERRALDLRRTIEDNLDIFQDRLARNRVKVETTFAEICPMVHADTDQMSQVLINLVMNAIHAMPDGGTLRLALTHANDMVRLIVADTGHGIPQEVISKIFDPFFTTKEFGKGTGLGLTVVKGIIEEHNGTIHVESEPGKGTVFTICLPIHQAN